MPASPPCSVARAVSLVGDAWTILIIRELFFGARRFGSILERLGAPRAVVSERLGHLVESGLLERHRYQERPERFEYRLTGKARDLYPAIVLLMQWGDRWLSADREPPLALSHRPCGNPLAAEAVCSACSTRLRPEAVRTERAGSDGDGPAPAETRRLRKGNDRSVLERGRPCSVARALGEVGDRWTFLVLREAFFGARRFEQYQVGSGAATNIVADRLSALVAAGVLERRPYQDRPLRHEYRLTAKGRDFYGASVALLAWGDRWLGDGGEPPVVLTHDACGARFSPVVACACCHQPVQARDVDYAAGYDLPASAEAA